jgi:hypothetical protein
MLRSFAPLSIAINVLKRETIQAVLRSPTFHAKGWAILDRWAFDSPKELRALEAEGEIILLGRLLEQQLTEHYVLRSQAGLKLLSNGLTEHEILALEGVALAL